MSRFKASAAAMEAGRIALSDAAREIDESRAQLEQAYRGLQAQWTSSEARARADHEYGAVIEWLTAAAGWARSAANVTDDMSDMFDRVERSGLT